MDNLNFEINSLGNYMVDWGMIMHNLSNISFCLGEKSVGGKPRNQNSTGRILGKFRLGQTSEDHLIQSCKSRMSYKERPGRSGLCLVL